MPVPAAPLRLGDRGEAVAQLHRTLEAIKRVIDPKERDARVFGGATEAVLRKLQEQSAIRVTGVFDADTHALVTRILSDIGPFTVYGTVTDADARPVVGAVVVALDVDLRRREELGRATTDSGGEYEVRYAASRFTRAEKASADVVVRVLLDDKAVVESPIVFNAPQELRVDLTSSERRGPSEFEQLEAAVAPILAGAPLSELTLADVDFLVGETGLAAEAWRAYVGAQSLVAAADDGVPLAAFYGWRRTGLPETWDALRVVRIDTLRTALVDALDRNHVPQTLRNDLDAILARIPNDDRAGLTGLLDAVQVPPAVAGRLTGRVDAIDAVSDQVLTELIETNDLTREHAARIGLAASVYRLVGAEPATVAAVVDAAFPTLPGGRLREARDLAALDPADWVRTLESVGAPVPAGTTLEAHARTCAVAATSAFPEDALRHRAPRLPAGLADYVKRFRTLLRTSKDALDRHFDELDVRRGRNREALRAAHAEVRALVNTHPGLGLREVVTKGGADAASVVATRIGWVADVLARNPDTSFTELDYLPDNPALTAIDFGDLPAGPRAQVLAELRAHRRMTAVGGNAVAAQELMVAGLTSASAIARSSIAELVARTGIPPGEMQRIQANAVPLANSAALDWFGVYGATLDRKATPVRVIPSREQYFHQLPRYAALLTDQPWCACDDCQSVLSPAAYFVDLMHYVEKNILADSFASHPTHPLHLERRRPDLWELPLSCANTKDTVPTLDIVNDLLERYIREVTPLPAKASVYAHLAEQEASFRQPFTLPIERLDTLLGHFSLSRHAVARSMRAPRGVQARARLGLSPRAYALITTERTDPAYLTRLFGIETAVTAPDTALAPVEMLTLLRATGLDHEVLEAALSSEFVRQDRTTLGAVVIAVGRRYPTDVQNNTEVVKNLTLRRLDRLHRFVRLWRTLPWTVVELDYVLGRFAGTNGRPEIVADTRAEPGTLERITWLLEFDAEWSIPLEQILAVTDAFPPKALRASESLFDRLFNAPGFADRDGVWTEQTTGRFTHPAWSTVGAPGVASPDDNTLSRLLAGLQLEDQEFLDLVAGIRTDPALDHRPGTATANQSISLGRVSITSLYRHARLRAVLRLSVPDFVGLLRVVPRGSGQAPLLHLHDADDIKALLDAVAWQRRTRFPMCDLVYLAGGARPSDVPDPKTLAGELPAAVAAAADAATRASILSGADPLSLLDLAVGAQLGRSPQEIALLRACIAKPSLDDLAAIVRALAGGASPTDIVPLTSLLADVVRFHRLLPRPAFDHDGLTFLRRERTAFFGPAPTAGAGETITLNTIRRVVAYRELATHGDADFSTARSAPDVAAIRAVVANAAAATDAQLARALGTDEARVAALTPRLTRSGRPFDDLALLGENLALADNLGVSGEALGRMIDESKPATTFDQLSRAADDVLGAFRAKYPEPKSLTDKLEPYEDILRGRKRDGLVDYLTTRWPTPFSSPDRLYDYFLVDVMVEGCARTSRVVSATSSLQLYVHRVLMNLERSEDWDPAATPARGVFARFTSGAKRDEWQWRRHYRVWEANRKVFLYPENYIEPELRDDKTPLFSEMEDMLLMQDLTPQNVSDAYSNYLTGFDGLAQLQIAGAYRDSSGQMLHLFGVTQDDAPVYYYRSIDESRVTAAHPAPLYSPWHRIDLSIPVRKVSPFVHEGRLYLFWIENATRPINAFMGGTSEFAGYRHSVRVRYSTLRLDGTWAAPQLIRFAEQGGVADARIVEDPLDLTVVNQLETQIAQVKGQRPVLEEEVRIKTARCNQARAAVVPLKVMRQQAQAALNAPLTADQGLRMAGLIALGVPPHHAFWIVKADAKAAYQVAVDKENLAAEQLRNAENELANAQTRLTHLDTRIAELEAAKKAEVVHVRWDRSLRDHKDSLDSYHPDGWVWDRVYPGVHMPARPDLPIGSPWPQLLRLTMVPGGNRLPARIPAEAPFVPGDFDAVSGVLSALPIATQPNSASTEYLNAEAGKIRMLRLPTHGYPGQSAALAAACLELRGFPGGADVAIAPPGADVQIVLGHRTMIIVQDAGDSVLLRPAGSGHTGLRLATTLTRSLARRFWSGGPTDLLAADFQRSLTETRSLISPIAGQSDPKRQSPFHPEHPWLGYYRETFLHIPFLIADHLNTNQDFAAAQRWYHTIFDPTAADEEVWRNCELAEPENQTTTLRDLLVDGATLDAYRTNPFSPHAIARTRMSAYAKSIVMKYIDNLLDWGDSLFTQFTMESVNEATMLYVMARDILGPRPATLGPCGTDAKTRTYRQIRKGLGDVSDFLVELETPSAPTPTAATAAPNRLVIPVGALANARATTAAPSLSLRAVGPATTLTPGAPPASSSDDIPLTLGGPGIAQTPVALSQLSTTRTVWTSTSGTPLTTLPDGLFGGAPAGAGLTVTGTGSPPVVAPGGRLPDYVRGYGPGSVGTRSGTPLKPVTELIDPLDVEHRLDDVVKSFDPLRDRHRPDKYRFHPIEVVPPKDTVFCIPPNKELLSYWDRVDDRLRKIRNCMDISGARRRLELFAPELDPRMLVRMTAAGLTIDDILGPTASQLPAYRFTYLVDKAKEHVATVQSFGGQLLAALEKSDAQELEQLRAVHEQNLLTLRRKLAQLEIDAAEDTLQSLHLQKDAVEYRRQHFVALREAGTLPQERKQQDLQREASQFRTAASIAQTVASILTIIPDFGAPTAMKFGGSQLGAAGRAVGEGLGAHAAFLDTAGMMAGVEASVRRRDEEWKHQEESARRELAQLERSITAAEIRRDIAARSLEVHERTIEQAEEMFEFLRERFSSVDRYRLLAKDLRRLHKVAFDSALRLAQLAEQAYRAERQDDGPTNDDDLLTGGYWDAQNAGLLAGEKLLADLQRLERQYVARNTRKLEIEQSFSLAQLAPDRLAKLRLTGECSFSIPEWFFDLSYPGQYRRRLKAVRLTMPCVTGPYTNVGATLRLTGSRIRTAGPANKTDPLATLTPVPPGHTVSIATSKAQRDAGVFEFSFRDERYMPFEGAGAISDWSLTLPKTLRVFDYTTISDVVIHLDYTADHHAELERRWDAAAGLVTLLQGDVGGVPPLVRRFSLRDELPDVFHRLLTSPPGTEVAFTLDERRFSLFLAGRELEARSASISILSPLDDLDGASIALARKPAPSATAAYVSRSASAQPSGNLPGGLREFDCGSVLRRRPATAGLLPEIVGTYLVKIVTAGALGGAAAPNAIAPDALRDIVLRVGYRLAATGG
ncbi:neuraminidase-like domain-containing protein [Streptomyces massasporeus]|uniref:Tc toxin subunit A-related protein n=1 Tax=Streptomyces massasporeus TaxID=67324 RepID=UPI0037024587